MTSGAFGLDSGPALLLRTVHRLSTHRLVKIDLMGIELGAVDARETSSPPTVTRHAPHMPVPSTIKALSDTVVFNPNFAVVAATNFIIIIGPMATTSS